MSSHITESSPASSSGEIQGVYLLWPKKAFHLILVVSTGVL